MGHLLAVVIPKCNHVSLIIGIPGLAIQFGCIFALNSIAAKTMSTGAFPPVILSGLLEVGIIAGDLLLIIGLCFYAKAKGHSAAWGLFGLLSCIGLIVLAVLPDRTKGVIGSGVPPPPPLPPGVS